MNATPIQTTPSLFLRAAWGEDTPRAPLWLMRQAGRYLPEYRAIKERASFWEMVRTPELAAEVTLQPLRRFPLDAAILFSDIMTPLPAMGVAVAFNPGPVVAEPLRSPAQIEALRLPEAAEVAPFVAEAIRLVRRELQGRETVLIGFGGAPLTLATYLVQGAGSKDYEVFRAFLRQEPALAHRLLEKLTELTLRYLRMQVEAGAQAIQLFDSWAGLHDPQTYRTFGLPYNRRVLEGLGGLGVPPHLPGGGRQPPLPPHRRAALRGGERGLADEPGSGSGLFPKPHPAGQPRPGGALGPASGHRPGDPEGASGRAGRPPHLQPGARGNPHHAPRTRSPSGGGGTAVQPLAGGVCMSEKEAREYKEKETRRIGGTRRPGGSGEPQGPRPGQAAVHELRLFQTRPSLSPAEPGVH